MMAGPRVMILLGSKGDQGVAEKAVRVLKRLGVAYSVHVASAHRTPERVSQLIKDSPAQVLIGVSGVGAGLPGVIAALTMRPVIGVPVAGAFDSFMGVAQVPAGVPVATVGVDQGEDAALLAASILALSDESVQRALAGYRETLREEVMEQDEQLQSELGAS